MDKIIAIMVSIVAVIAIAVVVIFGGIAPAIETKGNTVETQVNGMSTSTLP